MGYINYSMSENAYNAYLEEKKPFSQWSKSDILDVLENEEVYNAQELEQISKYSSAAIKRALLNCTEWHHTSSYFNRTNFYKVYTSYEFQELIERLETITRNIKLDQEEKKEETFKKAYVQYLEWSGTRKHPKVTEKKAYALIKCDWAYISNGYHVFKKSINANGFKILETYTKAPKGTTQEFKKIETQLKKKGKK